MMKRFLRSEIDALEHLYKINLINSCSGFKSANLIGSISNNKIPNVAVFSSVVHMGSAPPLMGMVFRPLTVPRDTYKNIKETKYYTINHIHEEITQEAHHTSAKYPLEFSEFDATKLTPQYKDEWDVPFVKNAPVQLLMKYEEEYHIKSNDTILLIGSIEALFIKENLIKHDGFVDLVEGNVTAINGLDAYAVPKERRRYDYQRPRQDVLAQFETNNN